MTSLVWGEGLKSLMPAYLAGLGTRTSNLVRNDLDAQYLTCIRSSEGSQFWQ